MRLLSWEEFNSCVQKIAYLCRDKDFSGVYGVPRGGLCLAVSISHILRIPFLQDPAPNSLVVDDVYETGLTLDTFREIPDVTAFVWLSKVECGWWNAIEVCAPEEWIVFPWEEPLFAKEEEEFYRLNRN
ncbi:MULTISPECIES: phosphoribosyltransferase [Prochlorococcus]|uniref:Predicted phosphoribosyltransferase n=1 Tax=Prochlorococcus marinus (strain SARG / CCMP1375 / SS120) TaxID=167539 RepID=Q7VB87_PROMA|nr:MULTISPECIES: phosphoribosyltransferase [Prochlorococcus]AAQ00256.1 Predicted phosphoribosyltransferase [Prochlorococcus marinus subsp. marinus str. CCMP1375]KGG14061.1 putative PURINE PHOSPHORIBOSYLTRANSFERASE related protein [Prochlorococcus marinus str. LG]KGG19194.1 putative PURINE PHOSPHORIBOSYLTRANSFERASE related protein [Prochlorococcus marinus str. SS2]KGG25171.1 putative PURINE PHOSPHORIBOSYLTRANSFERASE related protein [Prochlorococcus marinus str. SS35]KGG32499.1 putative PURINE P